MTRRSPPAPWTPTLGSAPWRVLSALDAHDARALPEGVGGSTQTVALTRLRGAGYITRSDGDAAHWLLTDEGVRARARASTGLTLRQAQVLLIIEGTMTAQALSDAFSATYGVRAREQIYQTLRALGELRLVTPPTPPGPWALTPAGRAQRGAARQRVALEGTL